MKIIHSFAIIVIIITLSQSTRFNIISSSICTNTSGAGFCTRWEQNGTVDEQVAACFSQDMVVLTKGGFKYMKELEIGDQIYSFNDQGEMYTKVRGWFHKDTKLITQYHQISLENGENFYISAKHNIAVLNFNNEEEEFSYFFANQITKNKYLFGSKNKVQRNQIVQKRGLYSPMTENNKYFVFTSKNIGNEKVLAHDFANIRNPEAYEFIGRIMFDLYETINGKSQDALIHPGAKWMMNTFSFIME